MIYVCNEAVSVKELADFILVQARISFFHGGFHIRPMHRRIIPADQFCTTSKAGTPSVSFADSSPGGGALGRCL